MQVPITTNDEADSVDRLSVKESAEVVSEHWTVLRIVKAVKDAFDDGDEDMLVGCHPSLIGESHFGLRVQSPNQPIPMEEIHGLYNNGGLVASQGSLTKDRIRLAGRTGAEIGSEVRAGSGLKWIICISYLVLPPPWLRNFRKDAFYPNSAPLPPNAISRARGCPRVVCPRRRGSGHRLMLQV